jgi:predicted transport protein
MATVEEGLAAQVRNIEATYGRPIDGWVDLIRASGLRRHGEIVAMLKSQHGLTHGAANRVALVALSRLEPAAPAADPVEALYAGRDPGVRAIHDRVMERIAALGGDIEIAPKKGYLSIRRRTQLAMVKPAAKHLDLGLVLPGTATTDRLESAATFNALFTHRVRVRSVAEVDDELSGWLEHAYDRAG